MALKILFGVAVVLIVWLAFIGFRRGLRRGIMTLAGSLLGAIMVNFWGEQWGFYLAERFIGARQEQVIFFVSSFVFLTCALIIGYGGGIMLGKKERGPFSRQLASLVLGAVNGTLITSYLFRFGVAHNDGMLELINFWPPTRWLYQGLPLLFLVVTVGSTLLILVRLLLSLSKQWAAASAAASAAPKPAQKPAPKPAAAPASKPAAQASKPASSAPAATAAVNVPPPTSASSPPSSSTVGNREVLDKVNDALKS